MICKSIAVYSKGRLLVPKCVFKTNEEVLKEINALLYEIADDDQIIIERHELTEEEFESLPEFEG